jgi:hypothetical protein
MNTKNLIIVSLIILNAVLVYQINSIPDSTSESNESGKQCFSCDSFFNYDSLNIISNNLITISDDTAWIQIVDFIESRELTLLVLVSDAGCVTCIEHEVNLINVMLPKYIESIIIVSASNSDNYLQRLYGFIGEPIAVRSENINLNLTQYNSNPVYFLVDKSGNVLMSHISETVYPEKSNVFLKLVTTILNRSVLAREIE